MQPILLNAWPDAGNALNISRAKLWELIASGELETVKIGARRLVPREALTAYVAKLREQAREQAGAA